MQEKKQLLIDFVIFIGDLKFKCTNSSAIVNNKRHKIVCEVYNLEGIACNKIKWKRGDTGEDYSLGSYNNFNVACRVSQVNRIDNSCSYNNIIAACRVSQVNRIDNSSSYNNINVACRVNQVNRIGNFFSYNNINVPEE